MSGFDYEVRRTEQNLRSVFGAPKDHEELITHGGSDYGYRLCQCHGCGKVARCTPEEDFYTRESDGESGWLYCFGCLTKVLELGRG